MRIKKPICQKGYFSLPSDVEKRVPGTLRINDGGKIELEIIGTFDEADIFSSKMEKFNRIVGSVGQYGLITLDDCSYINKQVSPEGISTSILSVEKAFLGVAYEEHEKICFNSIMFSIEGIDEWIGISGIRTQYLKEDPKVSITYSSPEEASLKLENGMILEILFKWGVSQPSRIPKKVELSQKAYFTLSAQQEMPLQDFISIIFKLTHFIGLAVNKTVSLDYVCGTSHSIQIQVNAERTVDAPIQIYYESIPFSLETPIITDFKMLFRFNQISSNVEQAINSWIDAYDRIEPAMNLFFATRNGAYKFISGRFLALAQCLESYHRLTSNKVFMDSKTYEKLISTGLEHFPKEHRSWLSEKLQYGYELSLAKRLKEIIEPFNELFGNSAERSIFIRSIVITRNYFTHYDKTLKTKAARGKDMFILCKKMEILFQLHLFSILKFSGPTINSIYKDRLERQLSLDD